MRTLVHRGTDVEVWQEAWVQKGMRGLFTQDSCATHGDLVIARGVP